MGERRGAYNILWRDQGVDTRKISNGSSKLEWVELVQDKDGWALVNAVNNFVFYKMRGIS
jgi:hypothetical protein